MSDTRSQNAKAARESSAAQTVASATEKGAETVVQNGQAAAETLRQGSETAAAVAHRAAQSGAETLPRSTEAVADAQRQISEHAAEHLQDASRTLAETARGAAEDMRSLLSLPTVADRGIREFHDSVTGLVEGVVRTNLRAAEELFRVTSPAGLIELQQRYVRDYMSALIEGSAAVVRAVRQTADQALPPLEQHLRQRRQTPGYQSAQNTRLQTAAE